MKISTLSAILHGLNHAGVRYLIVGGVAVNIHGYQRTTNDLDLVIQLGEDNLRAAIEVFHELGYQPTIPEPIEAFLDAGIREQWIKKKNMTVFSLRSNRFPDTSVDVFVSEPFDFDQEFQQAETVYLDRELRVKLIAIPALISMKQDAGRDRDRDDIQHLTWILEERNDGEK